MNYIGRIAIGITLALLAGAMPPTATLAADRLPLPAVEPKGTAFVDDKGNQVILKGCNLGNWLLLEMGMGHWSDVPDHYQFEKTLIERFGQEQYDQWMDQYREGFIQDRDFDLIKSFGLNCVRVPIYYNVVLESDAPYAIRKDAFRWTDRLVEMAERHGIYVILDLHGAPGAQSVDQPAGRVGYNKLWTDPVAQDGMVRFWQAMAERYHGSAVVAGYDILNEPYGDFRTDNSAAMLSIARRAYQAIRQYDPRKVIFLPALIPGGLDVYDTPEVHSWKGIGYTEHFYPGLFGSPGSLEDMAKFLKYRLDEKEAQIERLGGPFLVGEFNTVMHANGGVYMTRMQYDRYARAGWAATLWSYKILKPEPGIGGDTWQMVSNAQPLPSISPKTSTREEFDAYFDAVGKVELVAHPELREALTTSKPFSLPLPDLPPLIVKAPADQALPGWKTLDIGGAKPGGLVLNPAGVMDLYAAGADIYGPRDSFRFLCRGISGDTQLQTTLLGMQSEQRWAKAGVMIRWGDAPDAPHVTLYALSDGTITMAYRLGAGQPTIEQRRYVDQMPVQLRLTRVADTVSGAFSYDGKLWYSMEPVKVAAPADALAGLAACGHSDQYLIRATFKETTITPVGGKPQ